MSLNPIPEFEITSKSNLFIKILGIFAMIITISWGSIQIYKAYASSKDINLVAHAEFSSYSFPKNLYCSTIKSNDGCMGEDAEEVIEISSYWKFTIDNLGNKEVENIRIEVPFDGYYFLKAAGIKNDGWFDGLIQVGNIRPANTAEIWLVSEDPRSVFRGQSLEYSSGIDDIRITYPDGLVRIDYAAKAFGFPAWLQRRKGIWDIYILSFLIVFSLLGLVVLELVDVRRKVRKKRK